MREPTIFAFGFGVIAGVMLLALIAMIFGRTSADKNKDSTQWEATSDLTRHYPMETIIITDPTTKQKWLLVRNGGLAITPYCDKIKAEQ